MESKLKKWADDYKPQPKQSAWERIEKRMIVENQLKVKRKKLKKISLANTHIILILAISLLLILIIGFYFYLTKK